jgi:hypothetical protein
MGKLIRLIPPEWEEQRALVRWIRLQPLIADHIVKLNNEGKRTLIQGHLLKLGGLCTGGSDLFLAYPSGIYHGLWLEMKRNKKYMPCEMRTPTWIGQLRFLDKMRSVGYAGHIVYGWEAGRQIILDYLDHKDIG